MDKNPYDAYGQFFDDGDAYMEAATVLTTVLDKFVDSKIQKPSRAFVILSGMVAALELLAESKDKG